MELKDFIANFADQFDDTDASEILATTEFHELDEWDSLIALAVLNMTENHMKPNMYNQQGGIVEMEKPIHVSNVKVLESKDSKKAAKTAKVTEKATKEEKATTKKAAAKKTTKKVGDK